MPAWALERSAATCIAHLPDNFLPQPADVGCGATVARPPGSFKSVVWLARTFSLQLHAAGEELEYDRVSYNPWAPAVLSHKASLTLFSVL